MQQPGSLDTRSVVGCAQCMSNAGRLRETARRLARVGRLRGNLSSPTSVPPVVAAVMFAGVSNREKLYEAAGDTIATAAIETCMKLMREKTVSAKGRFIKTIDQSILAIFPSADAAANAAIEMQRAVSEMPSIAGRHLGLSIGINHGQVVERDGEVSGDTINLAARFEGIASTRQIVVGHDAVALMSPTLKAASRAVTTIRSKDEQIPIYDLKWEEEEDVIGPMPGLRRVYVPKNTQLRLLVQGAEVILSSARPAATLGKNPSADIVVREQNASGDHAKIERRLEKFVVTDQSANGTFITIEDDREIAIHKEQFTLRGHGWLAFGTSRATATDVVEFFCLPESTPPK